MDVEYMHLSINGYGHEPVPNELVRQRNKASTLAMMFPGQGYTCDMPLFYYAESIVLDRGWDVLRVEYNYRSLPAETSFEERRERLFADVDAAFAAGLAQRSYDRFVLIGKSLGTMAMTHLLAKGFDQNVQSVWLTPLIDLPDVRHAIEEQVGSVFLAIGSDDRMFHSEYLEQFRQQGVHALVIDNADHSLDVDGNVTSSIGALSEVMTGLNEFLIS